jgi:hypothetical protein
MGSLSFAKTINDRHLGTTASSVMTDCEHHGMTYGCTVTCPVLLASKCELQDDENKELYQEAMRELNE